MLKSQRKRESQPSAKAERTVEQRFLTHSQLYADLNFLLIWKTLKSPVRKRSWHYWSVCSYVWHLGWGPTSSWDLHKWGFTKPLWFKNNHEFGLDSSCFLPKQADECNKHLLEISSEHESWGWFLSDFTTRLSNLYIYFVLFIGQIVQCFMFHILL